MSDQKNEDAEIDEMISKEVQNRDAQVENSASFTEVVKPKKRAEPATEDDIKPTHDYSNEEKQDIVDENTETSDSPIDNELLEGMNDALVGAAGGKEGPLYKAMMRKITDVQAKDISFWAVKNEIHLNPIEWSNKKPTKWKYNYKRKIITGAVFERIHEVYNTPLTPYSRNQQLAELYFGVTKEEFDEQDAELWITILRAQQFRSNLSFR